MSAIPDDLRTLYGDLKRHFMGASIKPDYCPANCRTNFVIIIGKDRHFVIPMPAEGKVSYNGKAYTPAELAAEITPKPQGDPKPAWHIHDPVGDHMPERLR